ncbi:uncharacterized protein LOC103578175 isoform X1 [Microplitis demolitor]|uniref:uncharacterized protein LOC103578175 isoform X1 n=2 Tax=Microplitis demolitor TaxID=69319 RepID=UPI0004CD298A|nr:uncharacterized protein LOC103578175 isoform X1 [Microplitis demolitor]
MLDFEQQANQAQALASLDEDWHLLEDAKMRLEEDLVIRRSRPTMISAKYRAREERRRLLKISAGKLRNIEDPEASLCRSVLINNAVRRLHRENRDEKTRNYGLPLASYLDDSSKENDVTGNLIVGTDSESSKKRLGEELRGSESLSPKRQRHDDLDLQDEVFSDFYILPPSPRLLSHIDDLPDQQTENSLGSYHQHDNRLGSTSDRSTTSANIFTTDIVDTSLSSIGRSTDSINLMDVTDVGCDTDRICDFPRFSDSKTLEERFVELHSLDEHFDLTKFERNNNQSCGRAFHDIQTFHSLVPGLET